jgi:hypothetical protein
MTNDLFYSERETGVLPRTQERISFSFWLWGRWQILL